MFERIIILGSFALLGFLIMLILKKKQLKQGQSAANHLSIRERSAKILYFWSPQCQHCKTTQKPILESLAANEGFNVEIESININECPQQVSEWGVRTVPTTYILDIQGNIAHINNGLVTEKQLLSQLTGD